MMPALSVKWAACHDSVFHSVLGMAQMGREKRSTGEGVESVGTDYIITV